MTHHGEEECANRLPHWFAVAAFSIIALVSMTSNFVGDISDQTKEVKWSVSAVSIALSFSSLALLATFVLKDKFVGTTMETGMAVFTAGFWTAGLPAIMKPENNLAVNSLTVTNFNLYFFSWGAFLISFMIFFACISKTFSFGNVTNETTGEHRLARTTWAAMMAMSFIVMIASARIFQDRDCNSDLVEEISGFDINALCDRTKYGVSLGVISAGLSLIWLILAMFMLKGPMGTAVEFAMVWLLLVFWTCGVVFLTFNVEKAPASQIGNLYFFTWGAWALNVFMAMNSLENMYAPEEEMPNTAPAAEDKKEQEPDVEAVDTPADAEADA